MALPKVPPCMPPPAKPVVIGERGLPFGSNFVALPCHSESPACQPTVKLSQPRGCPHCRTSLFRRRHSRHHRASAPVAVGCPVVCGRVGGVGLLTTPRPRPLHQRLLYAEVEIGFKRHYHGAHNPFHLRPYRMHTWYIR